MDSESQFYVGSSEADFDSLRTRELESILTSLLIVKYPGIEQADLDRFFEALGKLDLEKVEQIEADMAQKSARWMLAALDLEQ
jgi:hypothetical protein